MYGVTRIRNWELETTNFWGSKILFSSVVLAKVIQAGALGAEV